MWIERARKQSAIGSGPTKPLSCRRGCYCRREFGYQASGGHAILNNFDDLVIEITSEDQPKGFV